MGFDPLAELLHPTISRNPHLAAAVGARVVGTGCAGTGHNPAAAWVQLITDTVHQAIHSSMGSTAPSAAAGAGAAAAAGGGRSVPSGAGAPRSANGGAGNDSQAAAPEPPEVREVAKLSSWHSLPQMITWYMEVGCKCSAAG
jgi:hypothetical protein